MEASEVKSILLNAGVDHLYHVNTVVTSLSFIRNGGLLSRQTAENMGIPQTAQETDETDKKYDVYNDIFFDSVDIHERAGRPNDYGVVMFVYSIDVLDSLEDFDICITRDNPIRWNGEMSYKDKYFTDPYELLIWFQKGNFSQHITVKNVSAPLSFDYLEEIVIENPGEKYVGLLCEATEIIERELRMKNMDIPLIVRNCDDTCLCKDKYNSFKQGYAYYRFKTTD